MAFPLLATGLLAQLQRGLVNRTVAQLQRGLVNRTVAQLQRGLVNRTAFRSFSHSTSRHAFRGRNLDYLKRNWSMVSKRFYYTKPKKSGSGQALFVLLGSSAFMVGAGIYFFGQPEEGLDGKIVVDEFSEDAVVKGYARRCWGSLWKEVKVFKDPSYETLLPDPLPGQYQPPYTVVIEMMDVLVHSEYDRTDGWRLRKRPGVDYLLRSLAAHYEVVLFTSEAAFAAEPVVAQLDPEGIFMYRLYRGATKYEDGVHIKDLTNLNRELSRVVMVDTSAANVSVQPTNALLLKQWDGDLEDTTLFDLANFLSTLAQHRVADVRRALDHYKSQGGDDVLATFRLNQERLLEERRKEGPGKKMAATGQRWGGGIKSPWS